MAVCLPLSAFYSLRHSFQRGLYLSRSYLSLLPTTMTPAEILTKVGPSFEKAQTEGDLLFFPSTIVKHTNSGIEVTHALRSVRVWANAPSSTRFDYVLRSRTSRPYQLPSSLLRITRHRRKDSIHSSHHIIRICTSENCETRTAQRIMSFWSVCALHGWAM
jgi:hypothetical protein